VLNHPARCAVRPERPERVRQPQDLERSVRTRALFAAEERHPGKAVRMMPQLLCRKHACSPLDGGESRRTRRCSWGARSTASSSISSSGERFLRAQQLARHHRSRLCPRVPLLLRQQCARPHTSFPSLAAAYALWTFWPDRAGCRVVQHAPLRRGPRALERFVTVEMPFPA